MKKFIAALLALLVLATAALGHHRLQLRSDMAFFFPGRADGKQIIKGRGLHQKFMSRNIWPAAGVEQAQPDWPKKMYSPSPSGKGFFFFRLPKEGRLFGTEKKF